ncbi:hypothetical protein BH10PSE5_BH10PSE5_06590 [soil metagenome]
MSLDHRNLVIFSASRYATFFPAFALPIARDGSRIEDLYVQIMDDRSQKIIGFSKLSGPLGDQEGQPYDIPISIGEDYIHAFVDRKGELYLGPIEDLKTILQIALNDPKTPLSTKLSICDQLGEVQVFREIRRQLEGSILAHLGSQAASGYINSNIRSRFWDILSSSATSPNAKHKIERARIHLDATMDSDGDIRVDASSIDVERDIFLTIDSIVQQLNSEFQDDRSSIDHLPAVDLSGVKMDPTPGEIISAVRSSGRQEERLAILLRALLVYPASGVAALQAYQDTGAFTQTALGMIRQRILMRSGAVPEDEREALIAQLIPTLFKNTYPLRRGELLYYLSLHLYDFRLARSTIKSILDRTRASNVAIHRDLIERALSGSKG